MATTDSPGHTQRIGAVDPIRTSVAGSFRATKSRNFHITLSYFVTAIRLKPKKADAWTERGYVCLLAAFGDLGNSASAVSDITTAVGLDPSLDRYISSKGKTAMLTLPPL
jgi:hypothetical protein